MKRDMDLIRELLLKLEVIPLRAGGMTVISPPTREVDVPGYDPDQIAYHLNLIKEAGLISHTAANPAYGIGFRGLSWDGHDFLDSVRDPEVWAKTKKGAAAAGGFTVDLLRDLAKGFIKKQVQEFTGVQL